MSLYDPMTPKQLEHLRILVASLDMTFQSINQPQTEDEVPLLRAQVAAARGHAQALDLALSDIQHAIGRIYAQNTPRDPQNPPPLRTADDLLALIS